MPLTRRAMLALTTTPWLFPLNELMQDKTQRAHRIRGVELLPVRATTRTVWLFIRLSTDSGLTGLGEASDAFGFANTSLEQARRMEGEIRAYVEALNGRSPFDIEYHRAHGLARAGRGLLQATAYSAVEQALWDLAGKIMGQPVYNLLGGKVRDILPVYANINRVTQPRNPAGFAASAKQAVAEGFRAIKLAPFDGFKREQFTDPATSKPVLEGIACIAAVRNAVGPDVQVMIDAHSLFDVPLSISVAQKLEPYKLAWYEEPVAPEMTAETLAIKRAIRQPMAGGEMLFGARGFAPLCRGQAVDVIMPDVKHCGGVLEMSHIAALAALDGLTVAPHNPSGPVATAVSVHTCAGMANFHILELQWGEVSWRRELVTPAETFTGGNIAVPTGPGLGIALKDRVARAHPL
ncbi:MAG: mandelate racemase/muconate lactonizing enzyme family protein [Blastocatellia bacterium]